MVSTKDDGQKPARASGSKVKKPGPDDEAGKKKTLPQQKRSTRKQQVKLQEQEVCDSLKISCDDDENDDDEECFCPHCKEVVTTEGVQCSCCAYWFHCICEDIDEREYEFLAKASKKISWSCTTCTEGVRVLREEVSSLGIRQMKIEKDIEGIKTTNEEILSDVDDLKKSVTKVNQEINNLSSQNSTSRVIDELRERERRKKQVVVFHLPESDKDEVDDRKADDQAAVEALCEKVFQCPAPEMEQVFRFGRKTIERPRPLMIRLKTEEDMENILEKWKKIPLGARRKKTPCVIVKDMTPEERTHLQALRQEQKKKQEELEKAGVTDMTIVLTKDNKLRKMKKIVQEVA